MSLKPLGANIDPGTKLSFKDMHNALDNRTIGGSKEKHDLIDKIAANGTMSRSEAKQLADMLDGDADGKAIKGNVEAFLSEMGIEPGSDIGKTLMNFMDPDNKAGKDGDFIVIDGAPLKSVEHAPFQVCDPNKKLPF